MTSQELKAVFGANVKERRKLSNLSQAELAKKTGVTANAVSGIENGKKFIGGDTLGALAEALGIEAYELFKPKAILPDDREGFIARLSGEIQDTLARFDAGK